MTAADIVAQIYAAFPQQPIDFEGALTGGLDEGAYRLRVSGRSWAELDREYAVVRTDVLSFLEPRHLVAVLPVYLSALVEEGTGTQVPDTLLLVLNRKRESKFAEIFDALTPAQRDAVVAALDVFAASESGQPAEAAREASERWRRIIARKS